MITYSREELILCPPGHPDQFGPLVSLADAVLTRYEQSGSMEDLEEVITYHREALTLCPAGHPDCASSLNNNNLASAVHTRYKQLGSMEDLEELIIYHSEALSPPFRPPRSFLFP